VVPDSGLRHKSKSKSSAATSEWNSGRAQQQEELTQLKWVALSSILNSTQNQAVTIAAH